MGISKEMEMERKGQEVMSMDRGSAKHKRRMRQKKKRKKEGCERREKVKRKAAKEKGKKGSFGFQKKSQSRGDLTARVLIL